MKSGVRYPSRLALQAATALASIVLACSLGGSARAVDYQTPAPLATPPSVSLSPAVLDEASRYHNYMRHVHGLVTRFDSGPSIEAMLEEAEAYEPQQLIRGAIAYGAVLSLQDPDFVAGLKQWAGNAASRRDIAERLLADPNYALALPGAASAATRIRAALHRESLRLRELGGDIKQAAYSIQREKSWSKDAVTDRPGRLNRAKSLSSGPMAFDADELTELSKAVTGESEAARQEASGEGGDPAPTAYSTMVNRALAIGAMAVLGEAGPENDLALQSLMSDPSSGSCLSMSKLNLYQCLAVARPWYEDMFCLGLHALSDTGECIAQAAGETIPKPVIATAAPTTSTRLRQRP